MIQTRTNQAKWDAARKRWRIDVQRNGVRRSFYSSQPGRNGKAECHRKADVWINEGTIGGDTRCGVLLDRYLTNLEQRIGVSKARNTRSYANTHIRPHIHNTRVCNLTTQHAQIILDNCSHLASNTVGKIRTILYNFLLFCRKQNLTKLTLDDVTRPKGVEMPKRRSLQPDELRVLFECGQTAYRNQAVQDWYIHAYRFLVATGLRPGELIALKHGAVDGHLVRITGSINVAGEHTEGKNANAKRDMRLSGLAKRILDDQYTMLGAAGVVSEYIFCTPNGATINERTLLHRWSRYCKHNNIPHTVLYELRHTYISINKDMPEALLKLQVGHTPDMDTYGVYSHKIEGDLERVAIHSDAAFAAILDRTFDRA